MYMSTPSLSDSESCTVSVTVNGDTSDLVDGFTYVGAEVTDVYPTFGVTTGGTSITVSGTGFRYIFNIVMYYAMAHI